MLILRHNSLSSEDLFIIERKMIKIAEPSYKVQDLQHFCVLEKSRAELYGYILGFLERLGLCETIGVTPSEFLDFLVDVDRGYLVNAYHSFYHAVDVAIGLYHMVCKYDVACYISRVDIAALLIAGLCHDIGHPGKNNNYQVNLNTELAVRYSNKSVLESYSCTVTMDLLTKHKLFKHLKTATTVFGLPTSESEMRTSIIKMILATDMIFHYELQENLANILEIISDEKTREEEKTTAERTKCNGVHKPMLSSTAEEEESEEEVNDVLETVVTAPSTSTSSNTSSNASPNSSSNISSITQSSIDKDRLDTIEENVNTDEIHVKDIFSTQGAKSAISYFRRKSYFEDDTIPPYLKRIPNLTASPEHTADEDENYGSGGGIHSETEDVQLSPSRRFLKTETHHTSGIDLITTSTTINGVEKTIYTPPNYIIEPQQRLLLCQIVLHAADISNALRPWPICLAWSNLVCEEFFLQGDAEREHGLQVSPNMDRGQVSQTTIGLRFGDFLVSPYFEIFAALFPKAEELLKTLGENREQWLKMEEESEKNDIIDGGEEEINERLPSSLLPDRPIINPSGRRVSVAAGMVVIPDELEERTVGQGKYKRKYWGVRSVSHSDISALHEQHRERSEVIRRRKSEEPNLVLSRNKMRLLNPMSPIVSRSAKKRETTNYNEE